MFGNDKTNSIRGHERIKFLFFFLRDFIRDGVVEFIRIDTQLK